MLDGDSAGDWHARTPALYKEATSHRASLDCDVLDESGIDFLDGLLGSKTLRSYRTGHGFDGIGLLQDLSKSRIKDFHTMVGAPYIDSYMHFVKDFVFASFKRKSIHTVSLDALQDT